MVCERDRERERESLWCVRERARECVCTTIDADNDDYLVFFGSSTVHEVQLLLFTTQRVVWPAAADTSL